MVDKGLVDSIIGLPTPTPDKLTVADIEEISVSSEEDCQGLAGIRSRGYGCRFVIRIKV